MVAVRALRMTGPLGVSVAVHAAVLGALYLLGRFSWPAPPLPIELVPIAQRSVEKQGPDRLGVPQAPAEAEQPPAPPKPRRPRDQGPGPKPPDKPAVAQKAAPQTSDLRPFAPASANLVVLLRSDKLRKSPHREAVEGLLGALPDYRTLLGGSGLSPINDFEALLIATANPRDVSATFLAARYSDETRVREIAARALAPGDPRVFRFPAPGLAVLAQPEDAERLSVPEDGEAATGDAPARWLAQLRRFDRVASEAGGPALVVTLADAPALLRFGGGLPTPRSLALAATADAAPSVRLKVACASESDAQRLEAEWPAVLARYRSATALLGLATALDALKLERHGAELEVAGPVPEAQMRLLLSWARALLPRPAAVDGGAPAR